MVELTTAVTSASCEHGPLYVILCLCVHWNVVEVFTQKREDSVFVYAYTMNHFNDYRIENRGAI